MGHAATAGAAARASPGTRGEVEREPNLPICFEPVKRPRLAPCTRRSDPKEPLHAAPRPAVGHLEDAPIAPRTTKVLILARETVIAALIGMLLEMEDYEPVYARPDERPEDALSRLRPPLVIVLDGELDAARSDLFLARAGAARARVVLFSEPLAAEAVQAAARERRLPYFSMPVDRATLGQVLTSATAG